MSRPILSILLVSVATTLTTAPCVHAADDDSQAVKAAFATFHEALNVLFTGDATPMKAVWSHADDVTYMGPAGGMLSGWPPIEQYWDRQAAKKLAGRIDPDQVHVFAGPTLAVVCSYEKGEHIFDGQPQPLSIRATTTFRKEGGHWKVIGHHTDPLKQYVEK